MSATLTDYTEMFGSIISEITESITMARCACGVCNACTCICGLATDFGEIVW